MRSTPWLFRLAGAAALLLAIGSAAWPAPPPAAAQGTSCVLQVTQPVPTPVPGSNPALAQNLRLTPQQKQAVCQAAENLERQNLALSRDLSSALLPGTLSSSRRGWPGFPRFGAVPPAAARGSLRNQRPRRRREMDFLGDPTESVS